VTAASELARNTLDYGLGGEVEIARVSDGGRKGLRLMFSDNGLQGLLNQPNITIVEGEGLQKT